MERSTYLIVDGVLKWGEKTYRPGEVFAANDDQREMVSGLGVVLLPFKNTLGGRRLLKPDEKIMNLPARVLENIRTEALMIAYHHETKTRFSDVQKLTREYILEDIKSRNNRCRIVL
ncbi:MAG: hypothetical protein CSYNP_01590 [Syntrophus sp. SKADARSKE-3]|nr:hypothetical protein [Syntrophus sp. SKADARSKE-3]